MKAQTFEFASWKPLSKSSLQAGKNEYGEWVEGHAFTEIGIVTVYAEKGRVASFRAFVGGKIIDGNVTGRAVTLSIPRLSKMASDFAATVKSRCRVKK